MAPAQTLKWIETNNLPSFRDVEIEGTEPYIQEGILEVDIGWIQTGLQPLRGYMQQGCCRGSPQNM